MAGPLSSAYNAHADVARGVRGAFRRGL